MWQIRYKEKIIYSFNNINNAKNKLHEIRLNGGDGFIYKVT